MVGELKNRPYTVDYAKSGKAKCRACRKLINKGFLRLALIVPASKFDGVQENWYHKDCFFKKNRPRTIGDIGNFDKIRVEDQNFIKDNIGVAVASTSGSADPQVDQDENKPPEAKKMKSVNSHEEEDLKAQQKRLFEIRDELSLLNKKELTEMLNVNNQYPPRGPDQILDVLADGVLFGALKPCPKCRGRLIIYESGTGYKCNRMITKWVHCSYITQDPKREAFLIPENVKIKCPFFANFKPQVQRRLLKITEPSPNKEELRRNKIFQKVPYNKLKQRVKGGDAVDPDSGLEDVARVFECDTDKYTVTLGITDIQTNRNSYYKLQILKHDTQETYWLFCSWGRIGTTSGDYKCDNMSLEECIQEFERLYEEKSGNKWIHRDNFVKRPCKFYPIEIDHCDDNSIMDLFNSNTESKLKKPVQDLIRLIFDKESMKKTMMEYEIDMDKMPLGKISKKQIYQAYNVLCMLLILVKSPLKDRTRLIEASNKFYTLIPHNFGADGPKTIDTEEEIQAKSEMLLSLHEMEITYSLLPAEMDQNQNPLDVLYERLDSEIEVLDPESDEFKLILKYVENTHSEIHDKYELVVEEVFKIKKNSEETRYKAFEKLSNRKLLWHGSRTSNFAAILSQGLRIAPPEAPATGYMFGKGIYFADMVSKSANYCKTDENNTTGLVLVCEVALGNMYVRYDKDYIEKLPDAYQSTWARGKTQPDPEKSVRLESGVEIPCGPQIHVKLDENARLHHNEFIVYDVAQVKIEYLIKMNFKYKSKALKTNIFAGIPVPPQSMFGGTQFAQSVPTTLGANNPSAGNTFGATRPPATNIFGAGPSTTATASNALNTVVGGQSNTTLPFGTLAAQTDSQNSAPLIATQGSNTPTVTTNTTSAPITSTATASMNGAHPVSKI